MTRSLTPATPDGRAGWRIVLVCGMVAAGCAKIGVTSVQPGDGAASDRAAPNGAPDLRAVATDTRVAGGTDVPPPKPTCVNLQCQQVRCDGGETTVSGTAFAPNGTLPLYNVMVYVPNGPLEPFKAGLTCDRCGVLVSGRPLVSAISDHEGKFKIANVPAGTNIPLVLQVGKWRRQITIPSVVACQDNPITDAQLTRLPRNRQEGDMPKIAVTTGRCDLLGCLMPKLGIDTAELGVEGDDKAVTFYKGSEEITGSTFDAVDFGPPNMTVASKLWRNGSELEKHDLTLLSCECTEQLDNKGAAAFDAMTNYLARGGRIFGSDFMYVWYRDTPDPQLAGAMDVVGGAPTANSPMTIDTTFPKGKALADWMKFVDPMVTYGQITSAQVFANLRSAMPAATQVWASSSTSRMSTMPRPRIVTINTPVGVPAEQQCGRAVHLDAHIAPLDLPIDRRFDFPKDCGTKLNKGEEALAFLFFDLAACIQKDTTPVEPPPIL